VVFIIIIIIIIIQTLYKILGIFYNIHHKCVMIASSRFKNFFFNPCYTHYVKNMIQIKEKKFSLIWQNKIIVLRFLTVFQI
jgi:hypothetical protein